MTELSPIFVKQMQDQLGDEFSNFKKALDQAPPVSIRRNPFKKYAPQKNWEAVKWNAHGWYLEKRPIFTLDPAFHAGAYYVQEASSMFVATIIEQCVDIGQPLNVLDLCAAPGGKSTLILSQLSSKSLLLANEAIKSRYPILKENLAKWGLPNYAICNQDPVNLRGLEGFFDVLLIDAPCSGEGLFRKDKRAIKTWSSKNGILCSARQKRIFREALPLLKKEGLLIYCTCTYNKLENEKNADWLMDNFPLKAERLKLKKGWNILEKQTTKSIGYQFYPHKVKGEGFFISCFRNINASALRTSSFKSKGVFRSLKKLSKEKKGELKNWLASVDDYDCYQAPSKQIVALPKALHPSYLVLDKVLKRKQFGIPIGKFKKNQFIPSHELALSTIIHPDLPAIEVDRQGALSFLKKEKLSLNILQKNWQLIRYQGLNLGWIKAVPGRINNYYPKEWRIKKSF